MYELFAEDSFSAAHRLINYAGNCSNWHGHNWTVRVVLAAARLDEMGLACDLRDIKRALADAVSPLDHAVLNDVPGLEGLNPTCENLARFFFHTLSSTLNSDAVRVTRVEVSETPSSGAAYFE